MEKIKYNYFSFKENYIKSLVSSKDTILVFNDYFLKNYFLKNRKKNILENQGKIYTIDEFKKEIFVTEKIILTEAKRPLSLYNSLSKNIKEEMRIRSYYDVIDIGDLFFKFYKELETNLIENIDEKILYSWQVEKIESFKKIKKDYEKYLEENNFIPSDWVEKLDNLDFSSLENYKKIIFVDVVSFSPLMKKILEKASNNFQIEIIIQGSKDIYNEKELKLDKINIRENILKEDKKNIKIYESKSELEEGLSLLYLLGSHNEKQGHLYNIYSPKVESNNFSKILPKYFITSQMETLEDSPLYKFMNIQRDILQSLEPKKAFGIEGSVFERALYEKSFCDIYKIDEEVITGFKKILGREYRYLTLEIFQESQLKYILNTEEENEIKKIIKIFNKIYTDVKNIEKFSSVEEFYNYFQEIGLEKFNLEYYKDFIEKVNEVFFSVRSSETLFGSFKNIFKGNIGQSLYTLIIKYMEGIEVERVSYKNQEITGGIIRNLDEARVNFNEVNIYVDLNNNVYPGREEKHFLFTDKQLEKLGISTFEEVINIKKYRYIQCLKNSKENIIFYKKESLSKIERSIFLEELIYEYSLEIEDEILDTENILEILKESLYKEKGYEIIKDNKGMIKNLLEDQIVVGVYDIINMERCQYYYYLKKVVGLEYPSEIQYGTSLMLIGNITHKIFEKIAEKMYFKIIKENDYKIIEEEIDKIINEVQRENYLKIPVYLDLYFKKIIFPVIKDSVKELYKRLEKYLNGEKVKTFFGEKDKKYISDYNEGREELPNIIIRGRADLIIEGEKSQIILDYKTGGSDTRQLDIYSLIAYGDSEKARKTIYNALSKKFEEVDKTIINNEKLNEIFIKFAEEKNYIKADKQSVCGKCEYQEICRREEEHE